MAEAYKKAKGFHLASTSSSKVTEHSQQRTQYEKHVYRKDNLGCFEFTLFGTLQVHKSLAEADF